MTQDPKDGAFSWNGMSTRSRLEVAERVMDSVYGEDDESGSFQNSELGGLMDDSEDGFTEQVYEGATPEGMAVYEWEGMGVFVLEESSHVEDQDNSYKSRVIDSGEGRYHLVEERIDGNVAMNLEVEGSPQLTVENPSDFNEVWGTIRGKGSNIGADSRLDSGYSASSEYFSED